MVPAIAVILIAIVSSGVVLLTVRLERLEAAPAVERAPVPVALARRPENIVERFVVALKQWLSHCHSNVSVVCLSNFPRIVCSH